MNIALFNNREIATMVWIAVIIIWLVLKRDGRHSMVGVLGAFFDVKILSSLTLMTLFATIVVVLLYLVNFWDVSLLKDTIIWFCFTGVVTAVNFITSESNEKVISRIVLESVGIAVLVEFLLNTFTFSLPVELLLVPVATILLMMRFVAKKKNASLVKPITNVQMVIGLVIVTFVFYKTVTSYRNLLTIDVLKTILLPPMLSILYSPFIYLLVLFSEYGQLFVGLNMGCDKDKSLKRYAKRRIILHCIMSVKCIKRFQAANNRALMSVHSSQDVDDLFNYRSKTKVSREPVHVYQDN